MPEFSGDYQDWLGFHDTFLALIHSNPEVAAIQKLHYLRASVKGEAAQVIESIPISAANYPLAWDALVARYSNEYLLKKRHLQAMFEISCMKEESAAALHGLVDDFERHTKVLKQLGEPTESWSTILEHLLCTRLHRETLKMWEDHASTLGEPSYPQLIEFLQRRMRVLESISVNQNHRASLPSVSSTQGSLPESSISEFKHARSRELQLSSHAVTEGMATDGETAGRPAISMGQLKRLNLQDRLNLVGAKRLCFNCLFSDHFVANCPSASSCRKCRKRHHTLLHPGYVENSPDRNTRQNSFSAGRRSQGSVQANVAMSADTLENTSTLAAVSVNDLQTATNAAQTQRQTNLFMLTAVIIIVDAYGQEHFARALLDCASQPNLLSDRMAQILRLKKKKVNVQLQGPGGTGLRSSHSVHTQVRSRVGDFSCDVEFLILPQVTTDIPGRDISVDTWSIPNELTLADPAFNKRGRIDMIIGLSHFFDCFRSTARVHLGKNLPYLVDSVFGWIVAGSDDVASSSAESMQCHTTAMNFDALEESLERFWRIEELPTRPNYTAEERECENMYVSSVTRDPTGRYCVRQPRHPDFDVMIGESKAAAQRRFNLLEKRLRQNPTLSEEYHNFMKEYLSLGHMRLAADQGSCKSKGFYLPHHPVVKESSATTKVRVVFDASSKTSTGFSLNDALHVGPVVQDSLLSIMLRFRTYPIAVVADIEKMYRQVLMQQCDVPYQKILWRFNAAEPVQEYELLTVTYGLAPSSFLATRTLQQLADDEGTSYSLAEPILRKNFYVDDCLGGAESIEEAVKLRDELIDLLQRGGFTLRKFTSNKLEVLNGLSAAQIGTQSPLTFVAHETVKTLGIGWQPEHDTLVFNSKIAHPLGGHVTKRSILSAIAQFFDPLGLIAPVIVHAKLLMQELWLMNCDWDQPIPPSFQEKWEMYYREMSKIAEFQTARYVFLPKALVELHTFCDASESAYGACTYARSIDGKGKIRVELLASKSRVAPLKRITLPRLELCAALIGAQLHSHISSTLQIKLTESRFWSDSTVTLQWLQSPPNTWKTFVANRVSEIQTTTHGSRWSHIAGSCNPADLVSRGMTVDKFLTSELWKFGPEWLSQPAKHWPAPLNVSASIENIEYRKVHVAVRFSKPPVNPMFTRYSTFNVLVKVTAYCLRFIHNVRIKARTQPLVSTGEPTGKLLSAEEIAGAKEYLVRLVQAETFREELKELKNGKTVARQSPIRLLSPFIDQQGVLRVGGRLRLSDQPFSVKHPALLPSYHPFTILLLKSYHIKLLHGGGQLMLATVREEYWPINGRRTIRSVIRACMRCARAEPVPVRQPMGQLPVPRVIPSRPFSVTGIDYAGPIYLRPAHKRACPPKAYMSIFVCFSTKAVHIELVSDLTTSAFLAAFRRFTSRRGLPTHVYSDNGTNFKGARNELQELYRLLQSQEATETIHCRLAEKGITWHMTPPKAPHFGGLWEAAVKVAKKHLHRQLGNSRLSFEDMSTVLCQIEASMNSRPLVPMSDDPNDFNALTPAHFLISTTMHAIPNLDVRQIPANRLDHYQKMQLLHQQFWYRWRTEYLREMQRESYTWAINSNLRDGQLVIMLDEHQAPLKWPLARIVAVHPGPDGVARVVTLKTSKGIVKRPVVKICLLPMEPDIRSEETTNALPTEEFIDRRVNSSHTVNETML